MKFRHALPTSDVIFGSGTLKKIGGGDSFAAGLIYGLTTFEDDLEKALEFAVATSTLKHSMYGDSPKIQKEEVGTLMEGVTSRRISR